MLYQPGCFTAATDLRLAKDVAENNACSRILIVCSEIMIVCFHAPSESHLDILFGSAVFTDDAAAAIVGAYPDVAIERPLFLLVSASQTIIPSSEDGIVGDAREMGLSYYLSKGVPQVVADNILPCLVKAFIQFGSKDWNQLFYIVHPGGPIVLDGIEEKIGFTADRIKASRHVQREYGKMGAPCALFVLDEMREKIRRRRQG